MLYKEKLQVHYLVIRDKRGLNDLFPAKHPSISRSTKSRIESLEHIDHEKPVVIKSSVQYNILRVKKVRKPCKFTCNGFRILFYTVKNSNAFEFFRDHEAVSQRVILSI